MNAWWLINVAPPVSLMLCGLLMMNEGKNALATALVLAGVLQVGALNGVNVWTWWLA